MHFSFAVWENEKRWKFVLIKKLQRFWQNCNKRVQQDLFSKLNKVDNWYLFVYTLWPLPKELEIPYREPNQTDWQTLIITGGEEAKKGFSWFPPHFMMIAILLYYI